MANGVVLEHQGDYILVSPMPAGLIAQDPGFGELLKEEFMSSRMSRLRSLSFRFRQSLVLAIVLAVVLTGCEPGNTVDPKSQSDNNSKPAAKKTNQQTDSNDKKPDPVVVKPLLEGWTPPAVAMILSGEQHGYFEPCGCSLTQSGGWARRGRLAQIIREKSWPLVSFDVGGTLRRNNRQDQIKFETILEAMKSLNYQGLGLGVEELRMGPDYLLSQVSSDGKGTPFLSANVVFFATRDLGTPIRFQVVDAGKVKIGVTSVLGLSRREDVAPMGSNTNITVEDPDTAITQALAEIDLAKPDLRLLLAHGTLAEAKTWAEKFQQFDVILTAGSPEEPDPTPRKVGHVMVLQVGQKGKGVGVLGYYPDDKANPLKFEFVDLDKARFVNDPKMVSLMETYQQRIQSESLATSKELLMAHPTGDLFVGAAVCGKCHTKALAKWKETKHSHAFETLEKGRPDSPEKWVSRIYDPECLACHVAGWDPQEIRRYESGYLDVATSAHLKGQQCENCHGPGKKHADLETDFRKNPASVKQADILAARGSVKQNEKTAHLNNCVKCHDLDNSPKYKFEDYWPKVKHPGKD